MKTKLLALAVVGALSTSSAWAAPYSFGGTGPQDANGGAVDTVGDVLDSIAVDNNNAVRFDDYMADYADSYWGVTASGSGSATMIIELAGYAGTNVFGIYDKSDSNNRIALFGGPSAVGDQASLSISNTGIVTVIYEDYDSFGNLINVGFDSGVFAGNNFGFYLDSTGSGNTNSGVWFSDSSLNSDGVDHMAAYQGDNAEQVAIGPWSAGTWNDNEYVLAFEDLDCSQYCDGDYADFMVMIESIEPVSSPGSLALMGLGLGLIGAAARRRSAKRA